MDRVLPEMTLPRRSLLPIMAAAALLGLAGKSWFTASPIHGMPMDVGALPAVPETKVVHFETPAADRSAVEIAALETPSPSRLTPDAAVNFATLCDLRLLAADTALELSDAQWRELAALVAEFQAVRSNYEADIAAVTSLAPDRHRLEIPAYPEAGDELRRRFEDELIGRLGSTAAVAVRENLGRQIEARFAGFGVSSQVLEITSRPGTGRRDLEVRRTARYWNSIEGKDRLTTRRDVFFPASEDPTGERWDALLALIGKAG